MSEPNRQYHQALSANRKLLAEVARLKAEVERLEQEVKYWRIEAETDNARWLRVLEDVERLRKSGDKLVEVIQEMDVVIDMDCDHPEVDAWNAAKEGKQP